MAGLRRPALLQALIVGRRVDIRKRPVIVNLDVAFARRVRSYDWLRPCGRIRLAQGVKERTIDEQRMAVLAAARGPNDRRVRLAVPIDNSSNGCRGQQR